MEHGKLYITPRFKARWCEQHGFLHGYLYVCEYYPAEVQKQIEREDFRQRAAISIALSTLTVFVALIGLKILG